VKNALVSACRSLEAGDTGPRDRPAAGDARQRSQPARPGRATQPDGPAHRSSITTAGDDEAASQPAAGKPSAAPGFPRPGRDHLRVADSPTRSLLYAAHSPPSPRLTPATRLCCTSRPTRRVIVCGSSAGATSDGWSTKLGRLPASRRRRHARRPVGLADDLDRASARARAGRLRSPLHRRRRRERARRTTRRYARRALGHGPLRRASTFGGSGCW